MGRNTFHYSRLLKAPSSQALNISREGASTTSLDNLFQCLTTLIAKNFSLTSNVTQPSFSLQPLYFVLSLDALVKVPFQLSRRPLQVLEGHTVRSPWGLLFRRLNNPNSLSFFS